MTTKVARAMVPAAPPEVCAAAALDAGFILALNNRFCSVWSVKLSKFVLLVKSVPLEGLCYMCFHVPFLLYAFWTQLFALWFCRCGMPEQ